MSNQSKRYKTYINSDLEIKLETPQKIKKGMIVTKKKQMVKNEKLNTQN